MDRGGALTGWHVLKRLLQAIPLQAAFPLFFLLLLGSAACRRAEDPAYVRGSAVVMAVPGVEVMKPDAWDFDFLTFLPLATRDERGELLRRKRSSSLPASVLRSRLPEAAQPPAQPPAQAREGAWVGALRRSCCAIPTPLDRTGTVRSTSGSGGSEPPGKRSR